jgi:aminopeptidase N
MLGNGGITVITVDSYDLAWQLDPAASQVKGCTTVRFRGSGRQVDLAAAQVLSASLNGRPVSWDAPLGPGTAGSAGSGGSAGGSPDVLRVEALFPFADRGFRRVVDPVDGQVYLYAASYPDAASRTMCHFADPDLRAPVALTVTVPPSWTCLSNGPAVIAEGETLTFTPTAPILSSTVAPVAGPFVRAHESVYVPRSRASVDGAAVADLMARSIGCYEELLGVPYPYPKCDAVFVHELSSLALSTPGLIVFDQAVLDRLDEPRYAMTVVSHEVAHQWSGNLVSTSSWLLEGLTVYLSRLFVEEALPGSRPWGDLPGRRLPDRPYAPHLARVLEVEARIGRAAVLRGLRTVMEEFAHRHAAVEDFEAHWTT